MKRSGQWQSIWDDRILEWMVEKDDQSAAPRELDRDDLIRVSKPHITRRLGRLHEHGLVSKEGKGRYIITERGIGYLEGEVDVAEKVSP